MKKIICVLICIILISRLFAQDFNKDFDRRLRDFLKDKFLYSLRDTINVKKNFLNHPGDTIYIYLAEFTFNKNGNIKKLIAYYQHNDTLKFYSDTLFFNSVNYKDIPELSLIPPSKIFSINFLLFFLYKKNVDDVSNLFAQNQFSANTISLMFKILSPIMNKQKRPYYILNPLVIFATKPIVN